MCQEVKILQLNVSIRMIPHKNVSISMILQLVLKSTILQLALNSTILQPVSRSIILQPE